jgi:tetratricopeptide (TPR) repeat protein
MVRDPAIRDAVVELLPPPERLQIHRAFADLFSRADLEDDDAAGERGRHLAATGQPGRAAEAYLEQARRHMAGHRIDEARRHYEEALRRLLSDPGRTSERLAAMEGLADASWHRGAADDQVQQYRALLREEGLDGRDRARIHRKIAKRYVDDGSLPEARASLASAQAEEGLDALERALLLDVRAQVEVRQGALAAAAEANREALEIAIALRDDRLLGRFYGTLGHIGFMRGDAPLALTELQRAVELFDAVGDADGYAQAIMMKGGRGTPSGPRRSCTTSRRSRSASTASTRRKRRSGSAGAPGTASGAAPGRRRAS